MEKMGEVCRNVDHLIVMRRMPIDPAPLRLLFCECMFFKPPFFACNETDAKQIKETS